MLIICEGEVTEPEYFALLRKISLELKAWDAIEIRPKPREDQSATNTPSTHKTPRPKRTFKNVVVIEDDDPILAEYDFKSQPISWVKEARDGLKDETYDEVWAVFDFDGRTKTESAFKLAQEKINDKAVNIAFSSVAFEHWLLLHFERNATSFRKSQCRNKKKIIRCGEGTDARDCQGIHCLIGYMRNKGYLAPSASTKKGVGYSILLNDFIQNRKTAYENAIWLRYVVSHNLLKPYTINPSTNVDILVQRLLGEEQEITWGRFDQSIPWHEIEIRASISNKSLIINFNNRSKTSLLINGNDVAVLISTDTIHFNPHPQTVIIGSQEQKEITESIAESKEVVVQIQHKGAKLIIG